MVDIGEEEEEIEDLIDIEGEGEEEEDIFINLLKYHNSKLICSKIINFYNL
jgi:hypothetical protein